MAPRAYNSDTRKQQQAELKERIAAAAAGLHAAKGALATSYAEIAQAVGVSLPTVYKHYPDLQALVTACSGHVASQAPAIPAEQILAAPGLAEAARLLVDAMDRLNGYFEPWLVWREHERIPVLAEMAARERRQLTALCAALLARHGVAEPRPLAATWETLLHFEFWHRLVRQHKFPRATVRATQVQLLLAVIGPRPAADRPSRPK